MAPPASFAFLGVVYGGFRATPLNLVAGVKTLAFVLSHSKAELILCADDSRSLVDEALAALVSAGETPPRVISMDVDDGPALVRNRYHPGTARQPAGADKRQHWFVDVYIGHHRRSQRRVVIT
jgi:acyl-CoA synthetase (AMP-forming)/AMP-acid ligase II